MIRPLEWIRPVGARTLKRAETVLGIYRVWTHAEAQGRWFWDLSAPPLFLMAIAQGEGNSERDARRAAEEHYQARILLALSGTEPASTPSGMSQEELQALPAHPLARWKGGLEMGIHRVHWASGGSSLVAIGQMADGRKWFAPCNWQSPSTDPNADFWSNIERTELLIPHPEPTT